MWGDRCIKLGGGIMHSQCIQISNHIVHFKYLIILFVNYISITLKKCQVGKRKRNEDRKWEGRKSKCGNMLTD